MNEHIVNTNSVKTVTLMEGRTLEVRLSVGALMRTKERCGFSFTSLSERSPEEQLYYSSSLIYECWTGRKSMDFEEFFDQIDPVSASEGAKEIIGGFGGSADGGPLEKQDEKSTSSNGGESQESSSDSPEKNFLN